MYQKFVTADRDWDGEHEQNMTSPKAPPWILDFPYLSTSQISESLKVGYIERNKTCKSQAPRQARKETNPWWKKKEKEEKMGGGREKSRNG